MDDGLKQTQKCIETAAGLLFINGNMTARQVNAMLIPSMSDQLSTNAGAHALHKPVYWL